MAGPAFLRAPSQLPDSPTCKITPYHLYRDQLFHGRSRRLAAPQRQSYLAQYFTEFIELADVVGFRVRNQNRVLQIDGEYKNLQLVSVANYSCSTNDSNILGRFADVPVPSGRQNVALAVKCQSANGVYVVRYSASFFRVYSGDGGGGDVSVFTAYIFADPLQSLGGFPVGLIVRSRTTREVVYNSNYKYLRILAYRPVNLPMPLNAQQPPSTDSSSYAGKSVAILQCARPYGRRSTPGGNPQQPVGIYGFFGSTMRTPQASQALIEHRVIGSSVGPNVTSAAERPSGVYLIIDVTGY